MFFFFGIFLHFCPLVFFSSCFNSFLPCIVNHIAQKRKYLSTLNHAYLILSFKFKRIVYFALCILQRRERQKRNGKNVQVSNKNIFLLPLIFCMMRSHATPQKKKQTFILMFLILKLPDEITVFSKMHVHSFFHAAPFRSSFGVWRSAKRFSIMHKSKEQAKRLNIVYCIDTPSHIWHLSLQDYGA